MKTQLFLPTQQHTIHLGQQMACAITPPFILTLAGEIGAGKTTMIRAFIQSFGIESAIKSPTFSIVESYPLSWGAIHHFDLYRIHDEEELEYIGFRDYFTDESICCIEWPERGRSKLEQTDLALSFKLMNEGREVIMQAKSPKGQTLLTQLQGAL